MNKKSSGFDITRQDGGIFVVALRPFFVQR